MRYLRIAVWEIMVSLKAIKCMSTTCYDRWMQIKDCQARSNEEIQNK